MCGARADRAGIRQGMSKRRSSNSCSRSGQQNVCEPSLRPLGEHDEATTPRSSSSEIPSSGCRSALESVGCVAGSPISRRISTRCELRAGRSSDASNSTSFLPRQAGGVRWSARAAAPARHADKGRTVRTRQLPRRLRRRVASSSRSVAELRDAEPHRDAGAQETPHEPACEGRVDRDVVR
jgi:hypothetical protein